MNNSLSFNDILSAHKRIKNHIKNTPLISDKNLNKEFGCEIFFKMENQQETKSFKARGAFNAILKYQEKFGKFPEKIVVQSSGNHAQAIAYACKKFGIKALIYMMKAASPVKINAARELGADVILLEKRSEVNKAAEEKQKEGYFFIHPSANAEVICGQGTAALEALLELKEDNQEIDAIFAPCGGGGLVSGTFLAAQGFSDQIKTFICEPLNANDVVRSLQQNKIFHFAESPNTIADGARTLATSDICFEYLKECAGYFEIPEEEIISYHDKLQKSLQQKIEITSALAFAGAVKFLSEKSKLAELKNNKILVIISGGNCV